MAKLLQSIIDALVRATPALQRDLDRWERDPGDAFTTGTASAPIGPHPSAAT